MNIKYLNEGEHLDLAIVFGNTMLCFAEHFDSFVTIVNGACFHLKGFKKKLQNPCSFAQTEQDIDSDEGMIAPYVMFEMLKNETIFLDGNRIYAGKKFDSSAHCIGTINANPLEEFYFIYTIRTRKSLIMTLYHVVNRETFSCEKVEEKEIVFSEDGFTLPCSLEEMNEFLKKDDGMIFQQKEIFSNAVLDCYSYYPNYDIKYENFKDCFRFGWNSPNDSVEIFNLYYWFSKPQYYNFTEACIERDEREKIISMNPYYTGEMPVIKKLVRFNAKADALLQKMKLHKDTLDGLRRLQENPKVGADGIALFLEFVYKARTANEDRDYEKRLTACDVDLYWRTPDYLSTIFDTFDITPKVLIDRTIREMVFNHLSSDNYWRYICDYVGMCKQLGIAVEKKLPKDVLHKHDILQTKVQELKDEAMKQLFAMQVVENKKLIEVLPDGIYTIISPENSNDLVEEGFRMNHCVGSYAYSYASGSSKIFFVRAKTDITVPVATLELDSHNRLVQISAFGNKTPDKSVLDYVNEWLKMIRKEGK